MNPKYFFEPANSTPRAQHLEIQLASKNDKIIRAMCELASGDAGLKSCMKPLLEEETKEGGGAGA